MNENGQAFMEFLTTYGLPILAGIITIGILAYFGVFNTSQKEKQTNNYLDIVEGDNNTTIDTSDIFYDNSTNLQWVAEIGKAEPINLNDLYKDRFYMGNYHLDSPKANVNCSFVIEMYENISIPLIDLTGITFYLVDKCYDLENGNLNLTYENIKYKKLNICWIIENKSIGRCN